MSHVFSGLAFVAFLMVLVSAISLWFGWAAAILWGWFMVPIFGATVLSTVQCWAIVLTISMFRPRLNLTKSDPSEFWSATGGIIIAPPISVALGWAIKNWFM